MVWSRSLRVCLVIVLAVGLTVVGVPPRPQPAHAATGDAVMLEVPSLVHSSGAELSWSKFAGPSVFDRYEVHRGSATGFSPVSSGPGSTLLATIRDVDTTRWVDTTAAPSSATTTKNFWYKVVVNGTDASNEQKVTMPLAGQATLTLQPGAAAGTATYIAGDRSSPAGCYDSYNYGASTDLRIGMAANGVVHRPLLKFDLRAIAPKATVISASLTLTFPATSAPTNLVDRGVDRHRGRLAGGAGRHPLERDQQHHHQGRRRLRPHPRRHHSTQVAEPRQRRWDRHLQCGGAGAGVGQRPKRHRHRAQPGHAAQAPHRFPSDDPGRQPLFQLLLRRRHHCEPAAQAGGQLRRW